MKTLKFIGLTAFLALFASVYVGAQTADVTVTVENIKDAKGKIMLAAGDKSKPQAMIGEMVSVTAAGYIVCVLKNVPVGKTNLYVYHDLNDNFQLDMDENQIPVEPCNKKEKVTIKEGENKIKIKLVNVKEMMEKR